jgi:hypothetical protein
MQSTESSIEHAEVGMWNAPAAQSAHGIRVLPERRFIEVGSIYVEMSSSNEIKMKMDYR